MPVVFWHIQKGTSTKLAALWRSDNSVQLQTREVTLDTFDDKSRKEFSDSLVLHHLNSRMMALRVIFEWLKWHKEEGWYVRERKEI